MSPVRSLVVAIALVAGVTPARGQTPAPVPPVDVRPEPGVARPRVNGELARARQRLLSERLREAELRQRRGGVVDGPEYTEEFSRTVALGRTGTFELTNPTGDVVVTGGRGGDLRIDATKRVRHRDEAQGRALLQQIQILVSERSGLVEVRTELPRARNWSGGVDYTIALPDSANVVLRTVSGTIRLTNVQGDLRAESVSGDVTASNLGRVRLLRSVSGDLRITDAEGQDVTAGTVSGDMTIRNLKAQSASLDSVSGDLRLDAVELTRARMRTVSGDIDYQGRLARGGRYDLQSHSGDIRIAPAGSPGFDLEASTFSGRLQSDFQLQTPRAQDDGPRRGPRTRMLRGTTGDAGSIITARSFSGDVTVAR